MIAVEPVVARAVEPTMAAAGEVATEGGVVLDWGTEAKRGIKIRLREIVIRRLS